MENMHISLGRCMCSVYVFVFEVGFCQILKLLDDLLYFLRYVGIYFLHNPVNLVLK